MTTFLVQSLGGKATAIKERKTALEKYYSNPNHCLFCNEIIKIKENQKPKEARVKKFCSQSCSAKYNNKVIRGYTLKEDRVKKQPLFRVDENVPISSLFGRGASKYALIRGKARAKMNFYKIDKRCIVCGYTTHVEVHHRKGCNEYPDSALLSEVNSLTNLIYLCPNHHYEVDSNLIKV